jgi:hypothetical protein
METMIYGISAGMRSIPVAVSSNNSVDMTGQLLCWVNLFRRLEPKLFKRTRADTLTLSEHPRSPVPS